MPGPDHPIARLLARAALAAPAALAALALAAGCARVLAEPAEPMVVTSPELEIRRVIERQVEAWNRGDVGGYMEGYARGPDTVFTAGGEIERGWETTLRRYQERYPDRAAMGTLALEIVDIEMLGPEAALVLGRWRLDLAPAPVGGVFTLVMRRLPEGWRIVHDHTSVKASP